MNAMQVENQIVIVTGSSRGIGKAISLLLARYGATVVVASRSATACVAAASQVTEAGGRALAVPTDVTDEKEVDCLVQATLSRYGRVDGLVNAAGVGLVATLPATTLAMWRQTIDVNLTGTFLCCRAVWAPMAKQGAGRILNISSSAVKDPHAEWSAYCASKAGVVSLTEALAKEGFPLGIRVNALLPGATATQMRRASFPSGDPDELLRPQDVAETALVFFGPAGTHLHGVQLEVRKQPRGLRSVSSLSG